MGELGTTLLEFRAGEDDGPPPRHRRHAVLGLLAALVTTVAATAVMVLSAPAPVLPEPSRPSAPSPEALDPVPAPPLPLSIPTEHYAGATVAEAVAGLEAVGAEVEIFDARGWERQVTPEWRVCTAGELYFGDTPSGIVQIAAVPAGDPCP
jgi:hypothetical protein